MADDRRPGDDRNAEPTVLVSGRARSLLRRVPVQLFAERLRAGDGVVVATTREDPAVVGRRLCTALPGLDADRVALIDCTSKSAETTTRSGDLRWQVPSPVVFEAIRTAVYAALDELVSRDVGHVHFLLDSLTTQFRLADAEYVHRHAHTVATTVGAERGLGVFTLEPSAATDREFERLKHLVDVHVAVRRTADGPEVRWIGLVGHSGGWVPLADSGFRFDALGKSLG